MLELCPRCHIPTVEQGCPRCGYQPGPGDQGARSEASSPDYQPPIQFDVKVTSKPLIHQRQVDWQSELKRKLDEHMGRTGEDTTPSEGESSSPDPEEPPSETPPTLFKYKLDRALKTSITASKRPASASSRKDQTVFEEPLVHRRPVRPVPQPPGQKTLSLRIAPAVTGKKDETEEREVFEEEERKMSKEVLFSRFLSGIVDLFLPAFLGLAFTIVASLLLGFDLFAPASMKWIGLLAVSFFFFNSLFFLLSSGQTPGMVMTDLRLVAEEEGTRIPVTAVVLRVLFFIPSVVTVIGLAWAIFDPLCRCLHDLVSRTRIEPAS